MKRILLATIPIILLASFVTASTNCPCSRPGSPGTLVGFVAKNGTTDNVTFYNDTSPELGKEFHLWAFKKIGIHEVPINGLEVTVELNSLDLAKLTTDKNGYVSFSVNDPGEYVITGGDAVMPFDIKSEEKLQPVLNNTTNGSNSTKPAGNHSSGLNESPVKKPEAQPPAQDSAPATNGSNDLWLYAVIILVVILILFSVKTRIRKRGCFRHRKSSAISERRRG